MCYLFYCDGHLSFSISGVCVCVCIDVYVLMIVVYVTCCLSPGQQWSLPGVITKNLTAQESSIFPSLAENSLLGLTVHVGNYMKDYWEHTAQSIEDTS